MDKKVCWIRLFILLYKKLKFTTPTQFSGSKEDLITHRTMKKRAHYSEKHVKSTDSLGTRSATFGSLGTRSAA